MIITKICCGNCLNFDGNQDYCTCSEAITDGDECRAVDMDACDFWEGNCNMCFSAGEPLFKRECADCDWEVSEEL